MELSELQVFLTVAGERSFSRAAAKLHRTQPAVSQAIRRLEEELGERLFDRSSKQGALTEAGPRAARLRAAADAAERGSRSGRARAARPAARPGARRRQRGRRARAAAAGGRASGRRIPRSRWTCAASRRGRWASRSSQGSLDFGVITFLPAERGLLTLVARPGRPGDARPSPARAGRTQGRHARRVRPRDRHRAQRPVAGARARAADVRAEARAHQHPGRAAEPRGDQARGRDEDGRGAAAEAVRALGARRAAAWPP